MDIRIQIFDFFSKCYSTIFNLIFIFLQLYKIILRLVQISDISDIR